MDNILVVKNDQGQTIEINVIDIIEDTETNKQYICYTVKDMSDVFISELIEKDDSFTLKTVSKEAKQKVEDLLSEEAE